MSTKIKLNSRKIHYSPRFIHLNEIFQFAFIRDYDKGGNVFNNNINNLIEKFYKRYNFIGEHLEVTEFPDNLDGLINTQNITINNYNTKFKSDKLKIAIVSVPITFNWCTNALQGTNINITLENKRRLYKLLEKAREEKVHYIVFPEFYLPIVWLDEVIDFAKRAQIGVISGLQYLHLGNNAYNYLVTIQPFEARYSYKYALPIIREKNNYPPKEKKELSNLGYRCTDPEIPNYQIYIVDKIRYSNLLCFELTDIYARSNLKTKINILFAPEYNPDTNYFSSIVTSTSRDLHCFMVQVNTSMYGDSRITGPYCTELKNIVQVKGGCNDVLIVGEIDINGLIEFQDNYNQKLQNEIRQLWEQGINHTEKPYDFKDLPARFV